MIKMKKLFLFGLGAALLAAGIAACSPARTATQDGVDKITVLMTDSQVSRIETGDQLLYNEQGSLDASVNFARAMQHNGMVGIQAHVRAESDKTLNDAAFLLLEEAFAVRSWQLHRVAVPREIVEWGEKTGSRFILITAHDGYVRTEQNFISRSAAANGAGAYAEMSMTAMTHTRATYVRPSTPIREFSDFHVALVDTKKECVLFAKESMENRDPAQNTTAVKQVQDALMEYFR